MPKLHSRYRQLQIDLFQAAVKRPDWRSLPLEAQQNTLKLLARLLNRHGEKVLVNNRKAAGDE